MSQKLIVYNQDIKILCTVQQPKFNESHQCILYTLVLYVQDNCGN